MQLPADSVHQDHTAAAGNRRAHYAEQGRIKAQADRAAVYHALLACFAMLPDCQPVDSALFADLVNTLLLTNVSTAPPAHTTPS